jgi:WD40 repeat protein
MRNGYLLVVDENFAPVAKTQHSKTGKEITVIKFSPDDTLCAVGGNDGRIKVYDVKSKFRKSIVIKKNTCAITHLDFSLDGSQIITNSINGEVLHFDSSSGKHLSATGPVKDARWHTWSCAFGW